MKLVLPLLSLTKKYNKEISRKAKLNLLFDYLYLIITPYNYNFLQLFSLLRN